MKKKIVLLMMLFVSANTFVSAQNRIEDAVNKINDLIKSGEVDYNKYLPALELGNCEETEEKDVRDPLEGKSEDYVRAFNDARRKLYNNQKIACERAGIDFNKTAAGKIKQDSVGIYAYIDNKLTAMEHIGFKTIERTGYINPFKDKEVLVFDNKTSPYQFVKVARFRVYFTHDRNSISEYYDMFSSTYTIDDFFVVKFKKMSKGRQMTSAVIHSNRIEGAKSDPSVKMNIVKVTDKIYDITVEGQPGEYCLTYNLNRSGTANGMKNSGSKTVFDFTIK